MDKKRKLQIQKFIEDNGAEKAAFKARLMLSGSKVYLDMKEDMDTAGKILTEMQFFLDVLKYLYTDI